MAIKTSRRACGSSLHAGFTLVELIAVLTIAAILAAMTGPRLLSSQPFAERGYADEVAAALRQARAVAVASDCPVQFTINSAGYTALQRAASGTHCSVAGAWTTPVLRGDGHDLAGWPPSTANVASPQTLIFATDGSLLSGSAVSVAIGTHTVAVDTGGWVQRQ